MQFTGEAKLYQVMHIAIKQKAKILIHFSNEKSSSGRRERTENWNTLYLGKLLLSSSWPFQALSQEQDFSVLALSSVARTKKQKTKTIQCCFYLLISKEFRLKLTKNEMTACLKWAGSTDNGKKIIKHTQYLLINSSVRKKKGKSSQGYVCNAADIQM